MRRRVHPPKAAGVRVTAIRVASSARLVTLEDPSAGAETALGAFARIRPPEGTDPEAVASWREEVAKVALAVRVLASPRADVVPAAALRDDGRPVGTIREEALELAGETGEAPVIALTTRLLDEVGA